MSSHPVVNVAALLAASLLCHAAAAQTSSAPLTRAEVKAETRAAEKAGKLTPAGQGPEVKVSRKSGTTRAQRKADTLAARKAGHEPFGPPLAVSFAPAPGEAPAFGEPLRDAPSLHGRTRHPSPHDSGQQ